MRERSGRSIDWMTFSIYLGLIGIGWMMIFTVGYGEGYSTEISAFLDTPVGKQTIWIGISLLTLFLTFIIDWKFWRAFANLIYGITLFLLVAVLIFGTEIKGAQSWFAFGGFTLQPSEFAKFGTCVAMASLLSTYGIDMRDLRSQLYAVALLSAPMVLILLQPDAGSALVFLSFFIVLFRVGFSDRFFVVVISIAVLLILGLVNPPAQIILWLAVFCSVVMMLNLKKNRLYWLGGALILASGSYFGIQQNLTEQVLVGNLIVFTGFSITQWLLKKQSLVGLMLFILIMGSNLVYVANFAFNNFLGSHQQERIKVWLKPEECDPQGAAYNLVHSKMAIGSGGWEGKGFLQGNLTQGNFVPEQITDFIFSTVGEEQGFVGSFAIIVLFWLLMMRIVFIAERQRSDFSRHYAYCVAGIIFIHVLINIGMTMGLMPIIGIPLPFISKGGSALLGFTIMIGVLLKLDSHRFAS